MKPAENHISANELQCFLADYAAHLLGCGATCIRIEKNVMRMAHRYGMEVNINIMPSYVEILTSELFIVRKVKPHGISFSINASLSRLSWEVADRKIDFPETLERFERIVATPPTPPMRVLLLASLANASFCRLFGGDLVAMAVVFVATVAGFRLRQILLRRHIDLRVAVVLASFFSATLSACCHIFNLGTTPEIALGTSVLYLVPGVPYINAVTDMIDKHYLCAFSRFMDALVLTVCLTAGLCLGIVILGLNIF